MRSLVFASVGRLLVIILLPRGQYTMVKICIVCNGMGYWLMSLVWWKGVVYYVCVCVFLRAGWELFTTTLLDFHSFNLNSARRFLSLYGTSKKKVWCKNREDTICVSVFRSLLLQSSTSYSLFLYLYLLFFPLTFAVRLYKSQEMKVFMFVLQRVFHLCGQARV